MILKIGNTYHVKVIKLLDKAIIVRLDDNSTELIHVSKLANAYVKLPEEYVSIDDEFDALGVEGVSRSVELSLKHLDLKRFDSNVHEDTSDTILKKSNTYVNNSDIRKDNKFNSLRSDKKMTLDEMIKKSNKSYEDKFKGKHFSQSNRRSSYHKHRYSKYEDD